jgi:hypothetical protein
MLLHWLGCSVTIYPSLRFNTGYGPIPAHAYFVKCYTEPLLRPSLPLFSDGIRICIHMSSSNTPAISVTLTAPTDADRIAAAEKCRWDTLNFSKCSFKLDEMPSWLDLVRTQLYTRKAAFLLTQRIPGDDLLQEMCLLALKSALPAAKRSSFGSSHSFTEAFQALVKNCEAAHKAAAISKQAELINLRMHSSETLSTYIDRASTLWGALVGSPQAIDESSAIEHMLRGLSSSSAWFLALATASSVATFATASELAMRHSSARVADSPEMQQVLSLIHI